MEFYTKLAALLIILVTLIVIFQVVVMFVPSDADNARFIPLLLVLLQSIPGDILELGGNKYSTLILSYIKTYQRQITTVDCDLEKINELSHIVKNQIPNSQQSFVCPKTMYKSEVLHNIIYNMNPKKYDKYWDKINHKHRLFYGIVIINNVPYKRRWKDIVKFSNKAYVLIINDAQNTWYNRSKYSAQYYDSMSKFKYVYKTIHMKPSIAVVSNYIDVARLLAPFKF